LLFSDRVLVTLVVLRFQLPHEVLAVMLDVDRSTITRSIHQIRPLLASRGFGTSSGVWLKSLADVFAYTEAEGMVLRLDATEIPVRVARAGGRSCRGRRR
jgi:hypothetical protein